jgi:hypothetical protein
VADQLAVGVAVECLHHIRCDCGAFPRLAWHGNQRVSFEPYWIKIRNTAVTIASQPDLDRLPEVGAMSMNEKQTRASAKRRREANRSAANQIASARRPVASNRVNH